MSGCRVPYIQMHSPAVTLAERKAPLGAILGSMALPIDAKVNQR